MKKVLAAVGLSLFLAAGSANAALVTDAKSFTLNSSTPYNFTLYGFDSSLGTLTDISLTTNTHITAQVQLLNLTNSSQSFTNAQSSTQFTLTAPGQAVIATASTGSINGNAAGPNFTISTFTGLVVNQSQTTHLASNIWNQYVGTSPLSLSAALGPFTSSASFTSGTLGVGGNGTAIGDGLYVQCCSHPDSGWSLAARFRSAGSGRD